MNPHLADKLPLIAVLEDDVAVRTMLQRILDREYRLVAVEDEAGLLACLQAEPVRLVLLDILLPGENGIEIARRLRAVSDVAIVMISGLSSAEMVACGLNIGADDYITKPFDPVVLQARVRNALRRSASTPAPAPQGAVELWGCVFDPIMRTVRGAQGQSVLLTETECQVLKVMARQLQQVVSRNDIARVITGNDSPPLNRAVDVHVSNLRRKLQVVSDGRIAVVSSRGVGYMLRLQADLPGAASVAAPAQTPVHG